MMMMMARHSTMHYSWRHGLNCDDNWLTIIANRHQVSKREREKERKSNITLNPFGRQQNSDDRHFFFFFLLVSLLALSLSLLLRRCSSSRNHKKKERSRTIKRWNHINCIYTLLRASRRSNECPLTCKTQSTTTNALPISPHSLCFSP